MQHILSLKSARARLPNGYARDVIESFLGEAPEAAVLRARGRGLALDRLAAVDAGDLFRTLVLDEHWSKEDAATVYYSAIAVLEARG